MPSFKEIRAANSVSDIKALFSKKPAVDLTETVERAPENFIFIPSLPETNLLPAEFVERQKLSALIRKFIIVGVAVVVLFAAAGGANFALAYLHQQQLTTIQDQNKTLTSQLSALSQYATTEQNLDSARQSISTTLSKDIDVAAILGSMNNVANQYGVSYSTLSMSISGSASSGSSGSSASGCLNPDPYNPSSSIGCLSLTGTANSQAAATGFFNKFNNTKGFENAFISSLNTAAGKVSFTGTVAFDSAFYSQKYANLATPIEQLLATSTTNTKTTAAETSLRSKFPAVFGAASNSTISSLVSQVCSAAGAGNATVTTLTSRASIVLGSTVSQNTLNQNATAIVTDVITSNCPTNLSKVNLSNTSSTTTPTSPAVAPTATATPAVTGAATHG